MDKFFGLIFLLTVTSAVSSMNLNVDEERAREYRMFTKSVCNLSEALCELLCGVGSGLLSDFCDDDEDDGEAETPKEAIIELPSIVNSVVTSPAIVALPPGDAKVKALIAALKEATTSAQDPFIKACKKFGIKCQGFWGSNIVFATGLNKVTFAQLAALPGTYTLRPQEKTPPLSPVIHHPVETNITGSGLKDGTPQWGVAQIRAPAAWSVNKGAGCVVGIIDTGVNLGHEALKDAYAGAWKDPHYSKPTPDDKQGHGSHCAGTILGRKNGVGVAPEAKWIACRGLDNAGSGSESILVTCGQFMLEASPRPHVVSNSWGGDPGKTFYNDIVTSWKAAGIIPVFAIGNSGPACETARSPGDQPGLISVGSTAPHDIMSTFSSRGPSKPGGLMKPDISAPGDKITSCGLGTNDYVPLSGTSMATPHVAGAICLIITQTPGLTTEEVLTKLSNTAVKPTLSNEDIKCGTSVTGAFPNNAFGAGRIDVGAALGV